jgi:transcriptional regulator with XRE-family HTH domain
MSELGDALRKLRLSTRPTKAETQRGFRRMTQELLAERLGWKNSSHVSEIEKGRRTPEAETIVRWVRACEGSMNDEYYLTGLGGYLPMTKLPNLTDLLAVLNQINQDSVSRHPYPSYIVDYRNWVWGFNSVCQIFFDEGDGTIHDLIARPVSLFHLMFDPRLPVRNKLVDGESFQARQIALFKMMNMKRQHEPFFKNFAEEISKDLNRQQAAEFKRLWNSASLSLNGVGAMHREQLIACFSLDIEITFNIFAENIYNFQDLFAVIRLEPDRELTTPQNLAELDAMCAPYRGMPSALLWEGSDFEGFVKRHDAE